MTPPDLGTLRALYDDRTDTLTDHQRLAYEVLGVKRLAVRQQRDVAKIIHET